MGTRVISPPSEVQDFVLQHSSLVQQLPQTYSWGFQDRFMFRQFQFYIGQSILFSTRVSLILFFFEALVSGIPRFSSTVFKAQQSTRYAYLSFHRSIHSTNLNTKRKLEFLEGWLPMPSPASSSAQFPGVSPSITRQADSESPSLPKTSSPAVRSTASSSVLCAAARARR